MHRYLIPALLFLFSIEPSCAEVFQSHPPMRPFPDAQDRPAAEGPAYYVDVERGIDAAEGTEASPWKTLNHAVTQLSPGDTLYLRGGTYYETLRASLSGEPGKPITLRSYPGELAILDGGYREFFDSPSSAWAPYKDGAPGEYRSVRTYPQLAEGAPEGRPVVASGAYANSVKVLGNLGGSMIPLHGYHSPLDLRTDNCYWNLSDKLSKDQGIYCGPGIWYATETYHIHARLAPTTLVGLGDDNYRGESDPRQIPLVIGGRNVVLDLDGASHLRLRDLVLRGTRSRTLNLSNSSNIELDGLIVYGGCPALYVEGCSHIQITNSAFRGVSAPWSFRSSEKYRGISTYVFIAAGDNPRNRDFEIAYSEFTDCHDGLIIGTIENLDFHHNLCSGFNDDGLYLTALSSIGRGGDNVRIHENLIERCYAAFSFAGDGSETDQGRARIYRNVVDLRAPVHIGQGKDAESAPEYKGGGRLWGDHGSPLWKPMFFYQNTFIDDDTPWRGYYGLGYGGHLALERKMLNNIFLVMEGMPGLSITTVQPDSLFDGNLHWSLDQGAAFEGDFFAKFRASKTFMESQAIYEPGWTVDDVFADPMLESIPADWREPLRIHLQKGSPAVDAGVDIPETWPDPLRDDDADAPDIGAMPFGHEGWGVGVRGRIRIH